MLPHLQVYDLNELTLSSPIECSTPHPETSLSEVRTQLLLDGINRFSEV